MTKKLTFEVTDFTFLEEVHNSHFATAEIEAFSSGDNLHDMTCPEEVLMETAGTIYEQPLIFEIPPYSDDFGTHDEDTTIPAGFIVPDSAEFIRRDDGRLTLKVQSKIWVKYARGFMEKFEKSPDKTKAVSVEMEVYEIEEGDEGALSIMKSFAYTAVTLLGDMFTPASPDARMKITSFAKEYEMALKAEFGGYVDLDFSIPKSVKRNAKKGLEMVAETEDGGGITAVSMAIASYLAKEKMASPEKVRQINKYFSRKNVKPSDKTGSKWFSWQLYGGNSSVSWARNLSDEMDGIDSELMTYFSILPEDDDIEGRKEKIKMKDGKNEKNEEVFETKPEEDDENVMMGEDGEKEEDMMKPESDAEMADEDGDEEGEEEMMKPDEEMMKPDEEMADEGEDDDDEEMAEEEYKYFEELQSLRADKVKTDAELVDLRKFKAEIDKERVEFEVNSVLAEVKDIFTEEEIEAARNETLEFSFDDVAGWANVQKAKAFAITKEKGLVRVDDDGITRFDILNKSETRIPTHDSIWSAKVLDETRIN